jgi:hypothetical protein
MREKQGTRREGLKKHVALDGTVEVQNSSDSLA